MIIRLLIALLILYVFLSPWWGSAPESSYQYRFLVANEELFALQGKGYYGSEAGLLTTEDDGDSWKEYDAPIKTRALCGSEGALFALTSDAKIYRKDSSKEAWSEIWSDHSQKYTYDIVCVGNAELYVIALDDILVLSTKGRTLHRYSLPVDTTCHKASMVDGKHLLVSCNPFRLAVVDTKTRQLRSWNEGRAISPDDGLTGPAHVKQHGNRFIVCTRNGVYIAQALMDKWEMLNDSFRHNGVSSNTFCRDLLSYDSNNEWLIATDAGIHRMEERTKKELIFSDADDGHNLIRHITPFNSYYFVSFVRLKESIGVRIDGDLNSWQTLRISE